MSKTFKKNPPVGGSWSNLVDSISELLEAARRASARAVNALMTATYWEIVEFEQADKQRAEYGEDLLDRIAQDLMAHFRKHRS